MSNMNSAMRQRIRARRAKSHTSQENLVKDSSSDVSPREPTVSRRRERRRTGSADTHEHVNDAFDDDERQLPPTIEGSDGDEADVHEQENIDKADRLVSHVSNQHLRIVKETKAKAKKSGRKTASSADGDTPDELNSQIRTEQDNVARRFGNMDETVPTSTTDQLPALTSTFGRDRSTQRVLERARKHQHPEGEDMVSTLGSTRGVGTATTERLQKLLRRDGETVDPTESFRYRIGGRSTRFDDIGVEDTKLEEKLEQNKKERERRLRDAQSEMKDIPMQTEQEDFFIKVWPDEPISAGPEPVTTDGAATTDPTTLATEERRPLLPAVVDSQLTQYQRAKIILDEDEEIDLENQRLKYVVGAPVSLQNKLGDAADAAHSPEDEGIFVGRKPIVPRKVVYRAEKRIIDESEIDKKPVERWFGPDGSIISLSDPTKFVPTRPLIDELFDPALGKDFYKAFTVDDGQGLMMEPVEAGSYCINIDLGSIVFLHHPLMSPEHVLVVSIRELYQHYVLRLQQDVVEQLSEKIAALRKAEKNAREQFDQKKFTLDETQKKELDDRLSSYQSELRQARNQRWNEMRIDREILLKLLSIWKQIKETRQRQRFVSTPIRLSVRQTPKKNDKEYQEFEKEIHQEINFEKRTAEEKYDKDKSAYKAKVHERKLQKIRKDEARKRLEKSREKIKENIRNNEDYNQDDINIVTEEDIVVPERPTAPDLEQIEASITAKYEQLLEAKKEPKIIVELVNNQEITADNECPLAERVRRQAVQSSSNVSARIFVNNKLISDTKSILLNSEFEGKFNEIYPCYVVRTPDIIKIELYDGSGISRILLSEIYLPIPERTVTSENYQLKSVEFASDVVRRFNPRDTMAVGSGVPHPSLSIDDSSSKLFINGILRTGLSWAVEDGAVLVPPDYETSKANQRFNSDLGIAGVNLSNMKSLIEWIKQSNLDPFHPDNAFFLSLLKDYSAAQGDQRLQINTMQHFRLSGKEFDDPLQYSDSVDFDKSLRFKLLEARNERLPDFKDCRFVPAYHHLVQRDHTAFKNYRNRFHQIVDQEEMYDLQMGRVTKIDIVRRQGETKLRKMRSQVQARAAVVRNRKTYDQMVVEESIPNMRFLFTLARKLTIEPNRPLYPARKELEKKKVSNLGVGATRDVFVLVTVISAKELPVREEALQKESNNRERKLKTPQRTILLKPYVEVHFQKRMVRTGLGDGPNPNWNEDIRVPFRPPDNDFDPSSLQRCRDVIHINVFDEVSIDLQSNEDGKDNRINKRIERNWIGSVKIPFTYVYINGKLEGDYRLEIPYELLGYTSEGIHKKGKKNANRPTSILRLFITIDPQLAAPEKMQQTIDSTESKELLDLARDWAEGLTKSFPTREYKATVHDASGRPIFIPRYLNELALPRIHGIDRDASGVPSSGNQETSKRLARFVSLIPYLPDSVSFAGDCDIWETADQFLATMAGDDEEHAVLLNNYFLTLNINSFVAFGVSIYSGSCCFVLTKNQGEQRATCWSVSDGQSASTSEPWNPFKSIYMLANRENIWANIQENDSPSAMNFDINNQSAWRPFFTSATTSIKLESVQPNELEYERTNRDEVNTLQTQIYEILRDKIQDWRLPEATRWNFGFQRRLNEFLKEREKMLFSKEQDSAANALSLITKELEDRYKINGFSLQMPYTNIRSIVDAVYSTKFYDHPTRNMEFALTVHLEPYPNNIIAVWIFLAHMSTMNKT